MPTLVDALRGVWRTDWFNWGATTSSASTATLTTQAYVTTASTAATYIPDTYWATSHAYAASALQVGTLAGQVVYSPGQLVGAPQPAAPQIMGGPLPGVARNDHTHTMPAPLPGIPQPMSPEENERLRVQLVEEMERQRARYADQERERIAAKARARELLRSFLTPGQWQEYEAGRPIPVTSQHGHRYRLHHRVTGNIQRLDARGRGEMSYCAHPSDHGLPLEDVLLSQVLALRFDENALLEVANVV